MGLTGLNAILVLVFSSFANFGAPDGPRSCCCGDWDRERENGDWTRIVGDGPRDAPEFANSLFYRAFNYTHVWKSLIIGSGD